MLVDCHSSKLAMDKKIQGHLKVMVERLAAAISVAEKLGICLGMAKQRVVAPSAVTGSREQFSLEVLDLRVDTHV